MSLGLGKEENSVSHLPFLDSALHSLHQTSSLVWINFYKQYHAKGYSNMTPKEKQVPVHPSSIPRSHLNDVSTFSEA